MSLLRYTSAWSTKVRIAASIGLLVTCFVPALAIETQSFDDDASATAAGWTAERNRDTELGTDFGFSDSNNAGGAAAGEAGGIFPRLKFPWAYYADTSLGGDVSLTQPLMASGQVYFDTAALNGGIDIGWMNTMGDPGAKATWVGLEVLEGDRFRAAIYLADGAELVGTTMNEHPTTTAEPFTINWDPVGGEAGGGLLTVAIADVMSTRELTIEEAELVGPLNAFGLLTSTGVGTNEPAQAGSLFIDDLSYSTAMTGGAQPGDYNGNGVVDAADYAFWRKQKDTSVPAGTGADGTGDGNVNEDDYAFWKERFGLPSNGGNGTVAGTVPEPTSGALAVLAAFAICATGKRRR